jgi:LAS superfamily LD-carboxypeptidase LdcB
MLLKRSEKNVLVTWRQKDKIRKENNQSVLEALQKMTNANARRLPPAALLRWHLTRPRQVHEWILRKWIHEWILRIGTSTNGYSMNGGNAFEVSRKKDSKNLWLQPGTGPV